MRSTLSGSVRTDFLTRERAAEIAQRLFERQSGGKAEVEISANTGTGTFFARGDAYLAGEGTGTSVILNIYVDGRQASVRGTRLDDEGLKLLMADAEQLVKQWRGEPQEPDLLGPQVYKPSAKTDFESANAMMTPDGRRSVFTATLDATEAAGLIGAGQISMSRYSRALVNTEGLFAYASMTFGEFSLTARTKDGTGSGWAWSGYSDWDKIKYLDVLELAIDRARRSAAPVAVEPGRYTVILEPTAVADLLWGLTWEAQSADAGYSVFAKEPRGTNKIGLKMMDERLNIVSDPWDPEGSVSTVGFEGEPLDRVQWFKDGVLQTLAYSRGYARAKGREPVYDPHIYRLYATGPKQSLEEMIATTKRGIWVTRFSGLDLVNSRTHYLTGTTRDGTFLIENGKVTKAIKNFRFAESPFFVFNRLEAAGEPVRANVWGIIAPRLKVRDFEFTSLTDAV